MRADDRPAPLPSRRSREVTGAERMSRSRSTRPVPRPVATARMAGSRFTLIATVREYDDGVGGSQSGREVGHRERVGGEVGSARGDHCETVGTRTGRLTGRLLVGRVRDRLGRVAGAGSESGPGPSGHRIDLLPPRRAGERRCGRTSGSVVAPWTSGGWTPQAGPDVRRAVVVGPRGWRA